ncbi:lipoxygenase homology domain-containing protein 1-like [Pomacea canaliculata]|uniref:lipoxygenase homology domain-containing protein 1-like n=1 Tax=Pomacea canaliculata TaxID=400727 RepID=UPI000D732CE2|nr:lipoxygenase homology domain-containing protein 1-like [Pomacea canaliculata]
MVLNVEGLYGRNTQDTVEAGLSLGIFYVDSLASTGKNRMWPLVFLLLFIQGFGVQGYEWTINVFTSDQQHAGTDSTIYITLIGTSGTSKELHLNNKANNFERGSKNTFVVTTPYIGELCSAVIRSSGRHKAHAWHLYKIQIYSQNAKTPYNLRCDCWISSNTQLQRKLYPDQSCKKK